MAKGTGLIGNFKGKVGNTVGYKLSASNNGQTQGIRVYQPIVKNPRTAAQAEQRAKLLAVNATYRALKMVIDRGNEGLPYGNKSRLAWLKGALRAEHMPWIEKNGNPNFIVGCPLTKGSLPNLTTHVSEDLIELVCPNLEAGADLSTVGKLSTAILAGIPQVKAGDQITIVFVGDGGNYPMAEVVSFIVDATSTETFSNAVAENSKISFEATTGSYAGAIILSRLGDNGEHLRSNTSIEIEATYLAAAPYDAASKAAAIASYQSSGYVNADWQEESVQ